jgi:glyoxylase-like metal-dependent hydrolase (beta-lactamase superfamily II)
MQPRARIAIGGIDVTIVSGGPFRLDGGGMFGIVPKALWERTNPADPKNRIALDTNCALLKVGDRGQRTPGRGAAFRLALIDTGNGTKLSDKDREIFAIDPKHTLVGALAAAGVAPEAIDVVLLTHLHLDHVGGAVLGDPDGSFRPTFPRARYVAQKLEWEDALANRSTMRTSYRPENLLPLQEARLLDLIDGDVEILPGVRTHVTGGHTRAHQAILLESEGHRGIYFGDLVPTISHLKGPYNMAYDLNPYDTMQRKLALLEQAAREEWTVIYDHEPGPPIGQVRSDERGSIVSA